MTRVRSNTFESTSSRLRNAWKSRRDWILVLIAPAILTAVVLNQHVLTNTKNLTAWKGGGFGMFATVDAGSNRQLIVTPTLRDGSVLEVFNIRDVLDTDGNPERSAAITAMPTRKALTKAAEEAIEHYRSVIDDPTIDTDDVVSMRIDVVGLEFDSRNNEMRFETIESVEVLAQ